MMWLEVGWSRVGSGGCGGGRRRVDGVGGGRGAGGGLSSDVYL